MPAAIAIGCFGNEEIDRSVYNGLVAASQDFSLEDKMRVFSYASIAATGKLRKLLEKNSLWCVRQMVIDGTMREDFYDFVPEIIQKKTEISLPLRINWGGTWTDTPPYCLENAGAVVNAAVIINGVFPVNVTLEKLHELKVVLEFFDSGYRCEYKRLLELSDFSNPLDPFLLLKSALAVCGLIPIPGLKPQPDIFNMIHGGIHISAGVVGIPKGSGLGTSSILLAACIKGIIDFIGYKIEDADLYRRVLLAEQLMGTGGGWQDQVGGFTSGIKLVHSEAGYRQAISCEHLIAPKSFIDDLNERFCLIYSGQDRLGRTILREIMGGYIQSNPLFIETLNKLHILAWAMKYNIESGNMEGFLENLNSQTELTRRLDAGYINNLISKILLACADMTAGKMICGAGGGGFIQIILKKGCSKQDLRIRLRSAFPQQRIDVWNCDLLLN